MRRAGARRAALCAAGLAVALMVDLGAGTTTAATGVATTDPTTNPLANRPWGVYKGDGDQAWSPYLHARGANKKLLAKIALTPKAKWFGDWISTNAIAGKVRDYISNSQAGDPTALVQMTIFRVKPWEHDACKRLPTAKQQTSYRAWIDRFAAAVGSTPTAIVLQPDGPFALCAPGHSQLLSQLVGYAATELSALPATSVYIDAGASDWLGNDPAKALQILLPAGIAVARGFALNSTHYVATADEVEFGTSVVHALEAQGIPGKHFVVNTAANGAGFDGKDYHGGNFDNATTCKTAGQTGCVTLGIPPTTDVANPAWGLAANVAAEAAAYVDAYLWVGRPWLYMQADPFNLARALQVARTTPYATMLPATPVTGPVTAPAAPAVP